MVLVELNRESIRFPTCYEEIKTRQLIKIVRDWEPDKDIAERNWFILFCILADKDFSKWANTPVNEVTIDNLLDWYVNQPFEFSKELPKALSIDGEIIRLESKRTFWQWLTGKRPVYASKSVDVPRNISLFRSGQVIQLKRRIEKTQFLEENISIAAAIALQPVWSGTDYFDYHKALELEKILDEMPAWLVYPIGFFLLRQFVPSGRNSVNSWLRGLFSPIRRKRKLSLNLPTPID